MGYLIAFAVIFTLALMGKSLVGFSLVVPLVLAVSFKTGPGESFLVAFVAGLLSGLASGSLLGRESLGFILAAALIHLYGRRFSRRHWAFTLFFAGLGSVIVSVVAGRPVLLRGTLLDAFLTLVTLPLAGWWRERFFSESITIKL